MSIVQVEMVGAPAPDAVTRELAAILVDAVDDGASVGFLAPLDPQEAQRWWRAALRGPGTITWICRDDVPAARDEDGAADAKAEVPGPVVGVVQLKLADKANASHRAEVAKLLVLRSARGRGVAAALLGELEREARARSRWLLMLDTRTASPAESLYERRGWQRVGVVDGYAADPDGRLAPCTFMTKRLEPLDADR